MPNRAPVLGASAVMLLIGAILGSGWLGLSAAAARPAAPSKDHAIAVCDVWTIAYELSRTGRHKEEEDKLKAEYDSQVLSLYRDLRAVQDKIRALGEEAEPGEGDNPERDKLYREYSELRQKYDAKSREFSKRRDKAYGESLSRCCAEVCAAAEDIAHEEGFAYVLSSCDVAAHKRLGEMIREERGRMRREQRAAAGVGDDPNDHADEDDTSETEGYQAVYYSERFRSVAVAPAETRIDDLIRDRLKLTLPAAK